jgi:glyoxylase-like metal-dependent hydrolase (beta-lactamase superfamily II)
MKLFVHSSASGSNNCYVVGSDSSSRNPEQGCAFIVDPGHIDQEIIDFIEDNHYTLSGILVTHNHSNHIRGVKTFMRIYNTVVFAVNPVISGYKTNMIRDGDILSIPPFHIEALSVPGHAMDAVVYKVNRLLFTGDSLSAGLVGTTSSAYGARAQVTALQSKIFSLPGNYAILPGHGPPSTLDVERRSNAGVQLYERSAKSRFSIPLPDFCHN